MDNMEFTMELKLFKLTVRSVDFGYKSERKVYGTCEESIRKGWEEYGLNKISEILTVEEVKEDIY